MSIFGELDIDEIPDDPFFIENGTYTFLITKAAWKTITSTDGSDPYTLANYGLSVNDETSEFHGKPVQQTFRVYPTLTREVFKEMTSEQQAEIKTNSSRHKVFLRGFGVSETEMDQLNAETTPEMMVGREATGDYKLNKSTDGSKTYRNIYNLRPVEDKEPEDTAQIGSFI